jgi:hypothetical protein
VGEGGKVKGRKGGIFKHVNNREWHSGHFTKNKVKVSIENPQKTNKTARNWLNITYRRRVQDR